MTQDIKLVPQRIASGQPRPRVAVAMSGGVDSSVAAALLVEAGYDVVGLMMRLWSESGPEAPNRFNRCCTPDQMADARRVADLLGIPFYVLDAQDYFRQSIVQFFIDEHARGRTPNPCIECNREIRFSFLLQNALALDAQFMATGHYARIGRNNGQYRLLRAKDSQKDQSYVLHVLNQRQLAQALFPIGDYHKSEVRELARHFGLPVASKQESQDLCFIADGDYRRFLDAHAPQMSSPGPIRDLSGREIGRHDGLANYTIGQRKGLGLSASQPLFVINKDVSENTLVVAPRDRLGRQTMRVRQLNWLAGEPPDQAGKAVDVKIRYKSKDLPATISNIEDRHVLVRFDQPAIGVTPGQGAVFYDGQECLGGGLIADDPSQSGNKSIGLPVWRSDRRG